RRATCWPARRDGRTFLQRPIARTSAQPARRESVPRGLRFPRRAPERNVGLDELADAVGIGKFASCGSSANAQVCHPTRCHLHIASAPRRLLETGESIAATAAATGVADQSHLHRHFQRTLGLTPAAYRRRVRSTG